MDKTQKFNVEMNLDELNLVLNGLAELPYKASGGLIQNLIGQYQALSAPPTAVPPAEVV